MESRLNYSGLVVAGIGFFSTRFTVTLAIYEDPLQFYLAGVAPLMLGLGLAAFGVALTIADVDAGLVRTTALWCSVGTGTMVVLAGLTVVGSMSAGGASMTAIRSQAYLSNFLIGGSIGGTLTGLYAARNRKQQTELRQQADRLEVLSRFLRHEVLNSVTAIRGYAAIRESEHRDAESVIDDHSTSIERTIEEVKYLTRTARTSEPAVGPLDLRACITESVAALEQSHPDVDVTVEGVEDDVSVRATDRLGRVFGHLLENAAVHGESEHIRVSVGAATDTVRISVEDDGPGLPESQRRLLEDGDIEPVDDPGTGFGLNVVRFLVESFQGSIEAVVDDHGTTITVVLPRGETDETGLDPSPSRLTGFQPSSPHLFITFGAALLAGVVYGVVSQVLGGSVSGIGVFYGAPSPVVGWITHEFHSVVFGFVFAGLVSLAPVQYRDHVPAYTAIAVGWGLVLWVLAAGVVAPVWLRLLGIQTPVPTFSTRLLATHPAWGLSLGPLTALGYRHVTPRLQRHGL